MSGKSLGFRADEATKDAIDDFKERNNYESRSDAIIDLVKVGLREQKTPLLYNLGETAISAAQYLVIAALVVIVIGASPAGFGTVHGMWIGAALVCVAAFILAVVELVKAVNGQSAIGSLLRGESA